MIVAFALELRIMIPRLSFATLILLILLLLIFIVVVVLYILKFILLPIVLSQIIESLLLINFRLEYLKQIFVHIVAFVLLIIIFIEFGFRISVAILFHRDQFSFQCCDNELSRFLKQRCVYKMPKFFHWIRGRLFLLLDHLMQLQELLLSSTTSSMVALDASQLALRIFKHECID